MEDYIKFPWYPDWFEWNTTSEEGRTLDRKVPSTSCNGKPFMKTVKGKDPLPWSTSKDNPRQKIMLWVNGKHIALHKYELIWMAHHKRPIPDGYVIHHIDFNKDNNSIENLQLLTEEEHRKLHGLNEKAVVALDEIGNVVHRFSSVNEAKKHGFSPGNVSKACRGCFHRDGNHYYRGLRWYYESEWLERK